MGRALRPGAGLYLGGKGGRQFVDGALLVVATPWRTFPRGLKRGLILIDTEEREFCPVAYQPRV